MVAPMRRRWTGLVLLAAVSLGTAASRTRSEEDVVGDPGGEPLPMASLIGMVDDALWGHGFRPLDARGAVDGIERRIRLQIDAVDRVCRLDASQRQRCLAAARAEARACLAELERIRGRCAGRFVLRDSQEEWDELVRIQDAVFPVRQRMGRPALGDTILDRMLDGVLDEGQRARWREETARRERLHWRVVVEGTAASVAEHFGLSCSQHDALLGVLLEKPFRIDWRRAEATLGGEEAAALLGTIVMTRADRARLRGMLSAEQWRRMEPYLVEDDGTARRWLAEGVIDE